jgi:SAM-dependent methyltransferase
VDEPYWRSPYIEWIDDLPKQYAILVCALRPARQQAKVVAIVEALTLLRDLDALALRSGPVDQPGNVFWLALPQKNLDAVKPLLPRLGYTSAVDVATPTNAGGARWRGVNYRLKPIYREDADALREQAPDRRQFLLRNASGEVVPVKGYRGDGQTFSKRGLPVYDARLLVNLAGVRAGDRMLDPFGGIGGVILAGKAADAQTFCVDNDPVVADGLNALANLHCLADVRALPFAAASFDAIATEPPYDEDSANPLALESITETFSGLMRVLKPGGRLAILCAGWQIPLLREAAATHQLTTVLESPINRKGLDVYVSVWQKI